MSTQQDSTVKFFVGMEGFGGGLSSENPIVVSANQMVVADNILIGTTVSRRKRGGQEYFGTSSFASTPSYPVSGVPIRGITEYWRTASLAGNPVADVFLHQGSKVWSIYDRNTPGVDRTGSLTLSSNGVPTYQHFNQQLYFTSTVTADGYNKWDGVSATAQAAAAPPDGPGKYIASHFGRMWMGGNNDFPFRVYYSAPLDPEDWSSPAGGSFDLDEFADPEGITGLISFQNRLYVFTRRTVFEVTGNDPDTFVIQVVSTGVGCIAQASICAVPNDILFASDRGVHSLRQLSSGRLTEMTFQSRDIQRFWQDSLNFSRTKQFMASYDEQINSYMITVPGGSDQFNSDILVFNIELGTWTQWKNISARSITTALIGNKRNVLIGKEDGSIAYLNRPSRTDFGQGYTATFRTGILYFSDPSVQKRFTKITLLTSATNQATVNVSWDIDGKFNGSQVISIDSSTDFLGTTFVLGSSTLGVGQFLPNTFSIDQVGFGIQIQVSIPGDSDVEIYGFIMEGVFANEQYT